MSDQFQSYTQTNLAPRIVQAFSAEGRVLERWIGQRLSEVRARLRKQAWVDLTVRLQGPEGPFDCRLIVHPNLRRGEAPRYLYTNLSRESFTPEQISDAYRPRWQVELLFKEWKSHANLRAFDTANPYIAEGLIWASLCAAVLTRYCAHVTESVAGVAISTQRVAKCIHHVLGDILHDLMHRARCLIDSVQEAIDYLARNAQRAHPRRDRRTGRLKLALQHVHAGA